MPFVPSIGIVSQLGQTLVGPPTRSPLVVTVLLLTRVTDVAVVLTVSVSMVVVSAVGRTSLRLSHPHSEQLPYVVV